MKQKGCKKTGGRVAGTPNKFTSKMKDFIFDILDNNQKQFEKDYKMLSPKERVGVYISLLQYAIPKCQKDDGEQQSPLPSKICLRYIGANGEDRFPQVEGMFPHSEDEVDSVRPERR